MQTPPTDSRIFDVQGLDVSGNGCNPPNLYESKKLFELTKYIKTTRKGTGLTAISQVMEEIFQQTVAATKNELTREQHKRLRRIVAHAVADALYPSRVQLPPLP